MVGKLNFNENPVVQLLLGLRLGVCQNNNSDVKGGPYNTILGQPSNKKIPIFGHCPKVGGGSEKSHTFHSKFSFDIPTYGEGGGGHK